jgi:hypothetical protein
VAALKQVSRVGECAPTVKILTTHGRSPRLCRGGSRRLIVYAGRRGARRGPCGERRDVIAVVRCVVRLANVFNPPLALRKRSSLRPFPCSPDRGVAVRPLAARAQQSWPPCGRAAVHPPAHRRFDIRHVIGGVLAFIAVTSCGYAVSQESKPEVTSHSAGPLHSGSPEGNAAASPSGPSSAPVGTPRQPRCRPRRAGGLPWRHAGAGPIRGLHHTKLKTPIISMIRGGCGGSPSAARASGMPGLERLMIVERTPVKMARAKAQGRRFGNPCWMLGQGNEFRLTSDSATACAYLCRRLNSSSEAVSGTEGTRLPSSSVLKLNYRTVFHDLRRRFVNLDSLPWMLGAWVGAGP